MTSVDEHAALIRSMLAFPPLAEPLPIGEALGRVTAYEVVAPLDLPLFRNSQMDGFAVIAADLAPFVSLPIVGEVAARASSPEPLAPGTAVRIMTGAAMPQGADAVVPVEDTTVADDTVTISRVRSAGEYVREKGSDLARGATLLPPDLRLASRHLAALAASGIATVEVRVRPRIAVITTGAELVSPGSDTVLGQIFDANAVALTTAVEAAGGHVVFSARVPDDREAMAGALDAALAVSDLVITSGGISMGDYEVVRDVLEPRGAAVGTIRMQPGGPQATAVLDGVPVVGFPGNPVSTQLSFELFVAPILRQLAGLPAATREQRVLDADVRSVPGKRQFLRGRAVASDGVTVVGGASSHLVAGLAASDLLIDVPEDVTELTKGTIVQTWAL